MGIYKGNFQPKLIDNCKLWLDAFGPVEENFTLNGSKVSQWNDKSGNNKNALQVTALNQPEFSETAVGGYPGLIFNGVNSYMSSGVKSDWTFLHDGNGCSVFCVYYIDDLNSNAIYYLLGTGVTSTGWTGFDLFYDDRAGVSRSNNMLVYVGRGSAPLVIALNKNDTVTPQSIQLATATYKTSSINDDANLWINANFENSGNNAVPPNSGDPSTTFDIGRVGQINGFFLKGRVFEIVVFDRVLDVAERNQMQNHLINKWGIS